MGVISALAFIWEVFVGVETEVLGVVVVEAPGESFLWIRFGL